MTEIKCCAGNEQRLVFDKLPLMLFTKPDE